MTQRHVKPSQLGGRIDSVYGVDFTKKTSSSHARTPIIDRMLEARGMSSGPKLDKLRENGRKIVVGVVVGGIVLAAGLNEGSIEPNLPAEKVDPVAEMGENPPAPTVENGGINPDEARLFEK